MSAWPPGLSHLQGYQRDRRGAVRKIDLKGTEPTVARRLLRPSPSAAESILRQLDRQHEAAQALAVRVEPQRTRDAAGERILDHEIERPQVRHLVAADRPLGEMRIGLHDALGGEMAAQPVPAGL